MLIFALNTSSLFGRKIADRLHVDLAQHEERDFEDGEHKSRPLVNVRNRDVFVIHSLYSEPGQSVNDKICRLLFFIGALRDASASRITTVIPYLAYARKDRKTKSRDPVTMKYMARLLEAAGADHIMSIDVHNLAAYQNAFRIPSEHLQASGVFAAWLTTQAVDTGTPEKLVVVSPDAGGIKRAEQFREKLSALLGYDIDKAFLEKKRSEGKVSGDFLVGEVQDRVAIVIDDIISSGTTIRRAHAALMARGVSRIYAVASHGLFTGDAAECLDLPGLEKILVTDTIPPFRLASGPVLKKLTVLSVAGLFAEAIRRMHEGGSVGDLLNENPAVIQE